MRTSGAGAGEGFDHERPNQIKQVVVLLLSEGEAADQRSINDQSEVDF